MLFNGKYYNKPGHLGMTRAELKEALQGGGGGGYDPDAENKPVAAMTSAEFASMLGGTKISLPVLNYTDTKFLAYMTLGVDLGTPIILYAVSYAIASGDDGSYYYTNLFSNTFYNVLASGAYCITATLEDAENRVFGFTATPI